MITTAFRQRLRNAAVITALLSVGGCANLDTATRETDAGRIWARQLAWLQDRVEWRASGRIAVRGEGDGGSASLHWRQAPEKFSIRLHGPFGQGAVLIRGDAQGVSLRRADGVISRAASARELLRRELGWSMPVEVLRYWILGRPAPEIPVAELHLNAAGLLGRLHQAGWQVRYLGYRDAGSGQLPAKLELRRNGLLIRVVIAQWRLPE